MYSIVCLKKKATQNLMINNFLCRYRMNAKFSPLNKKFFKDLGNIYFLCDFSQKYFLFLLHLRTSIFNDQSTHLNNENNKNHANKNVIIYSKSD